MLKFFLKIMLYKLPVRQEEVFSTEWLEEESKKLKDEGGHTYANFAGDDLMEKHFSF